MEDGELGGSRDEAPPQGHRIRGEECEKGVSLMCRGSLTVCLLSRHFPKHLHASCPHFLVQTTAIQDRSTSSAFSSKRLEGPEKENANACKTRTP